MKITFAIAGLGLLVLAIIIVLLARNISKPITSISQIMQSIANGKIHKFMKMEVTSSDEIGKMKDSVNQMIESLMRTAEFAQEIGDGNLEAEFTALGDEDLLGNSLIEMRDSLRNAKSEEEIRLVQNRRQTWATTGYAKFGELLRQSSDDIKEYAYRIISNLAQYLECDIGALYIINTDNEEDVFLELASSYAYDENQSTKGRIEIGENLLGTAVLKDQTIYLETVPKDYLHISSGLGVTVPKSVLIVPLRFNDNIFGAIEVASTHLMKEYKRQFVEEIGESIASNIFNMKVNMRTLKLLEESRSKTVEVEQHEKTLQENLEQMKRSQQKAQARENELSKILDAVESITPVTEYDIDGKITKVNRKLTVLFGVEAEEIIGKPQGSFLSDASIRNERFEEIWKEIMAGKSKKIIQHIKVRGKEFWLEETYTPLLSSNGKPYKVLNIALDITDTIRLVELVKEQAESEADGYSEAGKAEEDSEQEKKEE